MRKFIKFIPNGDMAAELEQVNAENERLQAALSNCRKLREAEYPARPANF